MIHHLFLLAVLALTAIAEEDIPLKVLYQIVPLYPEVSFCDRTIVSGYWMDTEAGNIRHITYKGKIKPGETARELCNCMNKHMTQADWLNGADKKCISKCGYLTYEVIGKPDPTYDPNAAPSENLDRPLEKLKVIFHNTPTTDPVDLICTAKCTEESNIIYCTLFCPIENETRSPEECCVALEDYYNQNGWLEDATINCVENNDILKVNFIGSA